jgi:hypothetical protein
MLLSFRIQAVCISRTPQLALTTPIEEVEEPILEVHSDNDEDDEIINP